MSSTKHLDACRSFIRSMSVQNAGMRFRVSPLVMRRDAKCQEFKPKTVRKGDKYLHINDFMNDVAAFEAARNI